MIVEGAMDLGSDLGDGGCGGCGGCGGGIEA